MSGTTKKTLSFALVMLLVLTQMPLTAFAVNINTKPSDAGGINYAINTVGTSSDIDNVITLYPGTYDKIIDRNNNISFNNKKLTIQGNGGISSDVIIDANSAGRIFYVAGNLSGDPRYGLALADLTCINGNSDNGGAIFNNISTLSVTNCIFSDNHVSNSGGAIYNNTGAVTIADCTFNGNTASVNGGAIYNHAGAVTITDSTITGGIYNNTGGTLNIGYGSVVDVIDGPGTTNFEVLFGVAGIGGNLTATANSSPIASGDFVESGRQLEFAAVPIGGYRVKQWTVKQWANSNPASNPTGGVFDIGSLSSPYMVEVEFEQIPAPSPGSHIAADRLRIVGNARITHLSGTSSRLGVTATGGTPPYTYQWQQKGSWIDIPGATSAEFTWEGLTPGQTYTVRCIVKDRLGNTVTSPEKTFIAGEGLSAFPVKAEITSKNVNVRPEPNTKGKRLGRLQTGDEVRILGYTAPKGYPYGFFKIAWDNAAGFAYISADYVSVTFGTPLKASILGRVYMQSRMNTAKKYRLATLGKDDAAQLLGRYKSWWVLEYNGEKAYLKNGKYIQP